MSVDTSTVAAPDPHLAETAEITPEERGLAFRNHGLLQEALRYDTTPVGLHYLLVHYDIPAVHAETWTVEIGGLVDNALSISLDDIRSRPAVTRRVTFECAGNGRSLRLPRAVSVPWGVEAVGTAEWTGTPLRPVLEEAGIRDGARELVFTGADRGVEKGEPQFYERALTISEAMRDEVLLVYGINGQPLPPQHGSPLRLVVPGWYGMTNVKWLRRITAIDRHFDGYQHRAYRWKAGRDDPGTELDRMRPRALMVPPGYPDFLTRERVMPAGKVTLEGRAWSGTGAIARVEVTTDAGRTWFDAELEAQPDPFAWARWTADWEASAGEHRIGCRATDADGVSQPLESEWNYGGFAGNGVTLITVTVSDA